MKEINALSTGTVETNNIQLQLSNPCLVFSISSLLCIVLLLVGGVMMYYVYAKDNLTVTHGIASGDVTDQSAIIWSRANKNSQMNVMYDTDPGFKNPTLVNTNKIVNSTTDYTSAIRLQLLEPNTIYYYRVWFSDPNNTTRVSNSEYGKFVTAPAVNPTGTNDLNASAEEITFVWGGDLGGQMYCRNVNDGGYSIFRVMNSLHPDFFVANGDMIYADGTCPYEGPTYTMNTTTTTTITPNENFTWLNSC